MLLRLPGMPHFQVRENRKGVDARPQETVSGVLYHKRGSRKQKIMRHFAMRGRRSTVEYRIRNALRRSYDEIGRDLTGQRKEDIRPIGSRRQLIGGV
jgi:hypothetical protein